MAADAVGLLAALGISSAHIVGASMGGMIAQTFAIACPTKTRTLTSIMSTTGDPAVGQPSPEALAALVGPAPTSREEAIESRVRISNVIGSPGFPEDESNIREYAASAYDRSFHPSGQVRQLAAVIAQPIAPRLFSRWTHRRWLFTEPTIRWQIRQEERPRSTPYLTRNSRSYRAWATTYRLHCSKKLLIHSRRTLLAHRH